MFKFIHAADIHLDSPLKGLEQYAGAPVDEIRGASRRALEKLVQLAIDQEVSFVLIAGDLYDGEWKDYNTGLYFVSQIVKLQRAGIAIYVISGNHDAANKMTRTLPLPKNPDGSEVMLSHKKPQTIMLEPLGVALHGQGFAKSVVDENVIGAYPPAKTGCFNIGILHTSLDSESEDQHSRYAPCKVSDLAAKGYQYWALGHIHNRSIRAESPHIVFPGNLQGRHIREEGEKGCYLVSVDDRGNAQLDFQCLDVFRWRNCSIAASEVHQVDDILSLFAGQLSKLVAADEAMPMAVRVTIDGRTPAHSELIADSTGWTNRLRVVAQEIAGGSVWLEKVKFKTTPHHVIDEAALADGPIGELVAMVQELRVDDAGLSELNEQLEDLRRKLPDELKRGIETLFSADLDSLRTLLNEVEPLLIDRLLSGSNVSLKRS